MVLLSLTGKVKIKHRKVADDIESAVPGSHGLYVAIRSLTSIAFGGNVVAQNNQSCHDYCIQSCYKYSDHSCLIFHNISMHKTYYYIIFIIIRLCSDVRKPTEAGVTFAENPLWIFRKCDTGLRLTEVVWRLVGS